MKTKAKYRVAYFMLPQGWHQTTPFYSFEAAEMFVERLKQNGHHAFVEPVTQVDLDLGPELMVEAPGEDSQAHGKAWAVLVLTVSGLGMIALFLLSALVQLISLR